MDVVIGDITEIEVDAIVNPTNTRLMPQEGIPAMVFRKGGNKIQIQCNLIIQKIQKLPIGAAVMTTGGNLKALRVIHTACPRIGMGNESQKLRLCVINSLKLIDKKNLSSIAFPLISTGKYGFTIKDSSQIMLKAIKEYVETKSKVQNIIFCLETEAIFEKFKNVLIEFQS